MSSPTKKMFQYSNSASHTAHMQGPSSNITPVSRGLFLTLKKRNETLQKNQLKQTFSLTPFQI